MPTGVVVLDMDGTILSKRSIDVFCAELGFSKKLAEVDKLSPGLPAHRISEMIAAFFGGLPKRRLEDLFDSIPLTPGVDDFVRLLKSREFLVAIATDSYEFLAERLAKRIGADAFYGNMLEVEDGILTGRLLTDARCMKIEGCREYLACKLWFMRKLNDEIQGLTVAVGDGESDFCAISGAEIGIAYRPKSPTIARVADVVASSYSEIEACLKRRMKSLGTASR